MPRYSTASPNGTTKIRFCHPRIHCIVITHPCRLYGVYEGNPKRTWVILAEFYRFAAITRRISYMASSPAGCSRCERRLQSLQGALEALGNCTTVRLQREEHDQTRGRDGSGGCAGGRRNGSCASGNVRRIP